MRQEIAHLLQDSVPFRSRRARGFSSILESVPVGKQLPKLRFHFFLALLQPVSGLVFALDGILIGAGDQRFLAVAMAAAFVAYVPFADAVDLTGAGLGWLWASMLLFMAARGWALYRRFDGDAWAVTGAVRA